MIQGPLGQLFEPVQIKYFQKDTDPFKGPISTIFGPNWPILGLFWPNKWKISRETDSKMDDIRSPRPTFRARSDKNIFEMIRTHLRVQFGPFLVQIDPF